MTHGDIYMVRTMVNKFRLDSDLALAKTEDERLEAVKRFINAEKEASDQFFRLSNFFWATVIIGYICLGGAAIFALWKFTH